MESLKEKQAALHTVLISGASIAGLSTAFWLTKYGFKVTLVQDESGVDVTFVNAAPQRFDLVTGADRIRSNVRKIVFGDDEQFVRYLRHYVAIFTMPNYFELDHWEMIFQHKGTLLALCIAKKKDSEARTYLGFSSDEPLKYDHTDTKRIKWI